MKGTLTCMLYIVHIINNLIYTCKLTEVTFCTRIRNCLHETKKKMNIRMKERVELNNTYPHKLWPVGMAHRFLKIYC